MGSIVGGSENSNGGGADDGIELGETNCKTYCQRRLMM